MTRVRMLLGALTVPALALAACGGGSSLEAGRVGRPHGRIPHATGMTDVVVRVATGGGFVPVERRLGNLPETTVYGDGRVIVLGPTILRYPGPALPNVQEFRVTEGGLQRILAAARDAGILDAKPPDYGHPIVTDLPTTSVVVDTGGKRHDVSVYALGAVEGVGGLDGHQREARKRLLKFTQLVGDESALKNFVVSGSQRRYEPDSVAVFVRPFEEGTAPDAPPPPAVDWPGGDLNAGTPNPSGGGEASCIVVRGAQRDAVLAVARTTTQNARWRAGGATYGLIFRPLLPDEHDCRDVTGRT